MALTAGAKLGAYEIVGLLGAGGMGEVYRARDPRLGRDVALKILPASFSANAERERRFEQEARAAAALNHPNILAVYDVGKEEGCAYIVSELLEGESLREKLRDGRLPLRRAIDYGLQVIHGLAAAHDRGILHRDLKPENIFITKDGRAKILDFGLAKLVLPEQQGASGATAATRDAVTGEGTLLGTVGYMSPEQVRGEALDTRSDLFSFGVVLYEMVSGERAFKGATTADTISAILKEDPPDLTIANRDIPPMLERIVRHCLEKEPAARFQSARDVAFDLESLSTLSSSSTRAAGIHEEKRGRKWLVPVVVAGCAVALAGAWFAGRKSVGVPAAPDYHRLTFARETPLTARFAPDQRTVIYSAARVGGVSELFSVTPDSVASTSMNQKGTELAAISPSGELLLIQQRRQLYAYARVGVLARAPLTGAGPRPVLMDVQDADWGPNNQIAVSHYVDRQYRLEYPIGHVLYQTTTGYISDLRFSPKGDFIAFADHPAFGNNAGTVAIVDASSGQKRSLSAPQAVMVGLAWAPSGKEVWFGGTEGGTTTQLKAVDLAGHARVVARGPGSLLMEDIARDGRVLLSHMTARAISVAMGPGDNREADVTVADWTLVQGISPDGRNVLLEEEGSGSSPKYDLYVRSTSGVGAGSGDSAAPVRIGEGHGCSFSPDMKWVVAIQDGQLVRIPLGPGEPQQMTHDSIGHGCGWFFPDEKTFSFFGAESGRKEQVYVQTMGDNNPRVISSESLQGGIPSADGKFVFGSSADGVELFPVDGQGSPRKVPGMTPQDWLAGVAPDGKSVMVITNTDFMSQDIFRVDLATGRREFIKKIGPADPAGTLLFQNGSVSADGKSYAYSYDQLLGELYTVTGLK